MMKPDRIRVAHVITRLDRGGSTENTLYSALLSDKSRFAVYVLSGPAPDPEQRLTREAEDGKVTFVPIRRLGRSLNIFRDKLAFIGLWRALRRIKPQVVHTHTSKAGILGRLAAKMAGVPVIIHTPHGHVFWGYYGRPLTRVFMIAEKICGLFTDRLIALTESEKEDYVRNGVEKDRRITVIPSGIDLARYAGPSRAEARRKAGLKETGFVIGTVARFEKIKNHGVLFEAALALSGKGLGFTWVFAGDGEGLAAFRERVMNSPLRDKMVFLGWREDAAELYPALDLFVLASLNEGMGRVFAEAGASGLPVVGSNVCGIGDVVENGESGFLHDPDDAGAMAESIARLMAEPDLRKRMGEAARRRISAGFDVKRMAADIESVYLEELKKKGRLA